MKLNRINPADIETATVPEKSVLDYRQNNLGSLRRAKLSVRWDEREVGNVL